jgi:hypothetical protein
MTAHSVDRAIEKMAYRQRGRFTYAQVLRAGGTDSIVRDRLASGAWIRVDPAVYALAPFAGDFISQCWTAELGNPGSAVAGLAAAAVLHFEDCRAGRPEIVVPPGSNARSSVARIHRYDGYLTTTVNGLLVTTRAQTLFDIAPRLSFDRLERVIDREVLDRRIGVGDLEERQSFYASTRRKGLPVMRALIDERSQIGWEPPASELERVADKLLKRLGGQPRIIAEASFPWLDHGRGRVDRYLPDDRIVLEIDGRRWHTRVEDFDRDQWRTSQIVAHGLLPLRFTYTHVTQRGVEVVATIEQTRRISRTAA